WDEQVDLGARHGVFTLATSWTGNGEAVEGFIEGVAPGKLVDAKAEVGDSKIRKGLVYAPSPGEILSQPDGTVAR
ncbi:MAG TPA: hypothetical protein VHA57_00885, partial [Actinomycetota bacterium]|nr:hypothetical protein [Actinomycetota bacterium]